MRTPNFKISAAMVAAAWAAIVGGTVVNATLACKGGDEEPTLSLLTPTTIGSACTDPAEFGVLPDDGVDDRPPLQAWLDEQPQGKCVALCFRSGTYEITRTGGTTHRRIAGVSLERSCLTLAGVGMATVLMGTGDGGGTGADFSVLSIKAPNNSTEPIRGVEIRDMRLSGDATYNTGEQTHVIEVGGRIGNGVGVRHVQLHHLWMDLPPKTRHDMDAGPGAWERRGDCIRVIGTADGTTQDVSIQDSVFSDCDRSSIGIQRHSYDLLITGNRFLEVGDQHIDEEPSGGPIRRTVIANNIFRSERASSFALTVTGHSATEEASDVVLQGNVIEGRGVMLQHVRRATIANNTINASLPAGYGTQGLIEAIKTQDRVLITGNVLRRAAGSSAGPVIRATYHADVLPGPLSIVGNVLDQGTSHNVVDVDSAQGAFVSGNDMHVASAPAHAAVMARGTAAPVNGIVVQGNKVSGPVGYLFRIQPAGRPVGYTSFAANSSWGVAAGLRCEAGTYDHAPVMASNLISGGAASSGCGLLATEAP